MALVTCPECKRDISTAATACPHCGARRSPIGRALIALIVIAVLAVLAIVFGKDWIDTHGQH